MARLHHSTAAYKELQMRLEAARKQYENLSSSELLEKLREVRDSYYREMNW